MLAASATLRSRGAHLHLATVVFLTLLASASPSRAGGFAVPEVGARRTGMAAVVGRPDELAAVYHNPAGLTLLPGTRAYVTVGLSLPTSEFRLRPWPDSDRFISTPVAADGYYPESKPTTAYGVIPMIALSTNVLSDKLWAALSFYVPNAVGASFDQRDVTRYHLIESYAVAGYGGLTVAWRPHPMIAVAGGLSLIYVRAFARREIFPILAGMDVSAFLGKDAELVLAGSALALGWNAGVLIQPTPALSVGATVIGGNHVDVEGAVDVTPSDEGFFNPVSGTHRTGLVIPYTLLLGANLDISRHVEVGAEFRYWYYAEFKNQHSDVMGISLLKALDSPKNYQNSWQLSGGVRVHSLSFVPHLEAMLGLHYDSSPAPDNTVSLDSPSFNHVGLHMGARYTLRERYKLALTYAHYWYVERRTDASLTFPPSNFVASGQNNIITVAVEVVIGPGLVLRGR